MRLAVRGACFSKLGEVRNLLTIQSPISVLYLAMAMKVGSMRELLILLSEESKSN
jgi:hypothetical protein